jgi:hypothetical protein
VSSSLRGFCHSRFFLSLACLLIGWLPLPPLRCAQLVQLEARTAAGWLASIAGRLFFFLTDLQTYRPIDIQTDISKVSAQGSEQSEREKPKN